MYVHKNNQRLLATHWASRLGVGLRADNPLPEKQAITETDKTNIQHQHRHATLRKSTLTSFCVLQSVVHKTGSFDMSINEPNKPDKLISVAAGKTHTDTFTMSWSNLPPVNASTCDGNASLPCSLLSSRLFQKRKPLKKRRWPHFCLCLRDTLVFKSYSPDVTGTSVWLKTIWRKSNSKIYRDSKVCAKCFCLFAYHAVLLVIILMH